jgi:hypothetical protein
VGWCAYVDEEAIEMTLSLQRFVLPVVQLMAGVSRPSWVALPYFVCSCASLFHWSVTSNFIGLSWYVCAHLHQATLVTIEEAVVFVFMRELQG